MKIDLKEIGRKDVDWIRPAQDRDLRRGFCKHGKEPLGYIKYW
jgi:hypothetical protein